MQTPDCEGRPARLGEGGGSANKPGMGAYTANQHNRLPFLFPLGLLCGEKALMG